jgi:ubiquinone/menaquinone biosynthesis C-methylase UbiE
MRVSRGRRFLWESILAKAASLFGDFFLFYLPEGGPGKLLLEVGCGTGADLDWA